VDRYFGHATFCEFAAKHSFKYVRPHAGDDSGEFVFLREYFLGEKVLLEVVIIVEYLLHYIFCFELK